MLGRIKTRVKELGRKIKHAAPYMVGATVAVLGQTNGTTTATFDTSAITNIIYAVLPAILMVYILRVLFRSFRDLGG